MREQLTLFETLKKCSRCGEVKEFKEFSKNKLRKFGIGEWCKACVKIYNEANKVRRAANAKIYNEANKDKIKEWYKVYNEDHKVEIASRAKIYNAKHEVREAKKILQATPEVKEARKMRDAKPEVRAAKNKRQKKRYKKEPLFKLKNIIGSRIRSAFRAKGWTKKGTSEQILGCTKEEAFTHLEKQFTKGMTWGNQGRYGWHIDHIMPLASATTKEEVIKLCHYTNLQPLWAYDNLSKGATIKSCVVI